jgi:Tol biopolymer transport system component
MVTFLGGGWGFPRRDSEVYVKQLPSGESIPLTHDASAKYGPVFTPDGSRVTYTAHGKESWDTWSVPVLGGSPTRLLPNAAGLSWIDDQDVLFAEIKGGGNHMGIVTATENRADAREIYFPAHERAMAHYAYESPNGRWILIIEMDRTATFQRCRVVPADASSTGWQVGPQGECTGAAWSPDGGWMYLSVSVDGSRHLWRQRFPNGRPQQITFGPTEEDGVTIAPDGRSLVTSVGHRRSVLWIHDGTRERALSVEGFADAARMSPDGRRVYYLLQSSLASAERELRVLDLATGKSEHLLPGLSVKDFDISSDQREVAFTTEANGQTEIWLASLDRHDSPRRVATSGDLVSFGAGGDLIFRGLDKTENFLTRIKGDGTQRTRVIDVPIVHKYAVSPDGAWAVVTIAGADDRAGGETVAVPIGGGTTRMICESVCDTSWSPSGNYLYVAPRYMTGKAEQRTLALPVAAGTSLPLAISGGFDSPAARLASDVHVLDHGRVAPGPDPATYAFVKSDNQQNLFLVPFHASVWAR